jgi:hypothetical protein
MADIFISYASEDRSRVEPLAKELEEQGWSVWWDRTIPPGKTFDQVIEEAIKAARCVIVLWSKKSIKSDWVKEEANIGKQRNILVPAKIDPIDPPLGFGRIQAAELVNWEAETNHPGFLSLLNAISEVAGPPPERDKSVHDTKLPESNSEQQLEVKSKEIEAFQPDPSHLKPVEKESPITGPKGPRKKRLAFGIGAVALILVLSVIGWFLFSKPGLYTITASSRGNGSISPTGSVSVSHGESKSFEITHSPDYRIADVKVDGKSVKAESSYTFRDVTSDHTIEASFERLPPIGKDYIIASFDDKPENWKAPGAKSKNEEPCQHDCVEGEPEWVREQDDDPYADAIRGNYLRAYDSKGEFYYFKAPIEGFLKLIDRNYYGGELSYWIRTQRLDGKTNYAPGWTHYGDHIKLTGENGVTLHYNPDIFPKPEGYKKEYEKGKKGPFTKWHKFSISLKESKRPPCWQTDNGKCAVEETIKEVLDEVVDLQIRGDYWIGASDYTALDEVKIVKPKTNK